MRRRALLAAVAAVLLAPSPARAGHLELYLEPGQVSESHGTVELSLHARPSCLAGQPHGVAVRYFTEDGSAVAGRDYEPVQGEASLDEDDSHRFALRVLPDRHREPEETFSLRVEVTDGSGLVVGDASCGTPPSRAWTFAVSIVDDDVPPRRKSGTRTPAPAAGLFPDVGSPVGEDGHSLDAGGLPPSSSDRSPSGRGVEMEPVSAGGRASKNEWVALVSLAGVFVTGIAYAVRRFSSRY